MVSTRGSNVQTRARAAKSKAISVGKRIKKTIKVVKAISKNSSKNAPTASKSKGKGTGKGKAKKGPGRAKKVVKAKAASAKLKAAKPKVAKPKAAKKTARVTSSKLASGAKLREGLAEFTLKQLKNVISNAVLHDKRLFPNYKKSTLKAQVEKLAWNQVQMSWLNKSPERLRKEALLWTADHDDVQLGNTKHDIVKELIKLSGKGKKFKKRAVPVRSAAQNEKAYDNKVVAKEALEAERKNFSGMFTVEEHGGVKYDGYVSDYNEKSRMYRVEPIGLEEEHSWLTPEQVAKIVVPFPSLEGRRLVRREMSESSGKTAFVKGTVKLYCGTLDEYAGSLKFQPKEVQAKYGGPKPCHMCHYYLELEDGRHEILWGEQLRRALVPLCTDAQPVDSDTQHMGSVTYVPGSGEVQNEIWDPADDMNIKIMYYSQARGKMEHNSLTVPHYATVSCLKRCIWQQSKFMPLFHPDNQKVRHISHGARQCWLEGEGKEDPTLASFDVEEKSVFLLALKARKPSVSDIKKWTKDLEERVKDPEERAKEKKKSVVARHIKNYAKLRTEKGYAKELQNVENTGYRDVLNKGFDRPVKGGPGSGKGKGTRRGQYSRWSTEEINKLITGVEEYGINAWAKIKEKWEFHEDRIPNDLRSKWRNLVKSSKLEKAQRRMDVPEEYFDRVKIYLERLAEERAAKGQ